MEELVARFGYLAIAAGTFLEGETIAVLGGLAAHRGYLSPWGAGMAAFAGTFLGDQLYFFIGRRSGSAVLERRPHWKPPVAKASDLLRRYDALFILGFRFLYGLRTVSPFVIGMSGIAPGRFLVLNAAAAAIWAAVVTGAGYFFGEVVSLLIGKIERYEAWVFAGVAVLGTAVWIFWFVRRRRRRQKGA